MRRGLMTLNYWARFRLHSADLPKIDGPPPLNAPVTMNSTKSVQFLDPVNDAFPRTIRGNRVIPDVPDYHFVDDWYFIHQSQVTPDLTPHGLEAPHGAFRFRPHEAFGSHSSRQVAARQEHLRAVDSHGNARSDGFADAPHRETYLTQMAGEKSSTIPSPCTIMERELNRQRGVAPVLPAQQQHDVGRIDPTAEEESLPNNLSSTIAFPYRWKVSDWYEYEQAKARLGRFKMQNSTEHSLTSSEVTYRLVLSAPWDHHAQHLCDDVLEFVRDVGRHVLQEKLRAVRSTLLASYSPNYQPDARLRNAFNQFSKESFDDEEIVETLRGDLELLEQQCVRLIALANGSPQLDSYNPSLPTDETWPKVQQLEAWRRMVEFWSMNEDGTFADAEMSTRKYEFRRFFRVLEVNMPFQSFDFERRLYDIRHWIHRNATVEFDIVQNRNLIWDKSLFPVRQDPLEPTTEKHHSLLSVAFDWDTAPAGFVSIVPVKPGDTWGSIAEQFGCEVKELCDSNQFRDSLTPDPHHSPIDLAEVKLPRSATKRPVTFHGTPMQLPLSSPTKTPIDTWEHAAEVSGFSVEELVLANPHLSPSRSLQEQMEESQQMMLNLPPYASSCHTGQFATVEPVFPGDSFADIADRIGTSVSRLREVNPGLDSTKLNSVQSVRIPSESRRPRPIHHQEQRTAAQTQELFASTHRQVTEREELGDQFTTSTELPHLPKETAATFPGEFNDEVYPRQPAQIPNTENWLNYTSAYLDPELSLKQEAEPLWNLNPVWPMQSVPGSLQQTPFEEDQTWLLTRAPLQRRIPLEPERHTQDAPQVNQELIEKSIMWKAP